MPAIITNRRSKEIMPFAQKNLWQFSHLFIVESRIAATIATVAIIITGINNSMAVDFPTCLTTIGATLCLSVLTGGEYAGWAGIPDRFCCFSPEIFPAELHEKFIALWRSTWPQLTQNVAESSFLLPHFGQYIIFFSPWVKIFFKSFLFSNVFRIVLLIILPKHSSRCRIVQRQCGDSCQEIFAEEVIAFRKHLF